MNRPPLAGYNHNLRYKNRVYHVQTEDFGVDLSHVYTHLFFRGMVIATARLDYRELSAQPEHEPKVTGLMQAQHTSMMKQLLRGELDQRIVTLLGTLEGKAESQRDEEPASRQIRSYRHQLDHAGRRYFVQTDYCATAVTDLFYQQILVTTERTDCRDIAAPGSNVVRQVAQEQHKRMIRRLRNGLLDEKIIGLLGSLQPNERPMRLGAKIPLLVERYHHCVTFHALVYDVTTEIFGLDHPWIVTRVDHLGKRVVTEKFDYSDMAEHPDAASLSRQLAQNQHKQVLKQLRRGDFDHIVDKLVGEEIAAKTPRPLPRPLGLPALLPRASGEFVVNLSLELGRASAPRAEEVDAVTAGPLEASQPLPPATPARPTAQSEPSPTPDAVPPRPALRSVDIAAKIAALSPKKTDAAVPETAQPAAAAETAPAAQEPTKKPRRRRSPNRKRVARKRKAAPKPAKAERTQGRERKETSRRGKRKRTRRTKTRSASSSRQPTA